MSNFLVEWVKFEEGFRRLPYRDSRGILTVGFGRNLQANPISERDWKEKPCTEEEGERWLREKLGQAYFALLKEKPIIDGLDLVRLAALVNMAYQLGVGGILKFEKMWMAVELGLWDKAAAEILNSKWAHQTPERAERVAQAMAIGEWPQVILGSA